ncbi:PREDICTED: cytochrome P450 4g15-like isoform X2 [Nicrophorus vespilloides]|nr:PREDICTED: cytochrome P450 4g15-like isoform X2 [Nicrophorus vespilloides]XP_017769644.1 PREDICTED: cytochrome P450 4g15-like isoform X2 [Nicrophorus vespilloides]
MLSLILIWVLIVMICYQYRRRNIVLLGSKLPGPKGHPIIGHALMFYGKPEKAFKKFNQLSKQFKEIIALWIGPQLHVVILCAKYTEIILKNSRSTVKSEEYQFLKSWLGDSILISEGAKFRRNKKLLTPSFHVLNLKQYTHVFGEYAQKLNCDLEEKANGEEFDIHPFLSLTTMYVLLETSLGVKTETLGVDALDYAEAVERLGRCAHQRVYKVWLRFNAIFRFSKLRQTQEKYLKVVHPLTERVIAERKKSYLNGDSDERSWPLFIDGFFKARDEQGQGLSDQEIKDEVMTMMFAGQDTTTVSVGFALSLLGLNPDIQDKLVMEIDKVFGDSERALDYEDCKNLPYMEQVIQETWRLYPPIPLMGKMPTEDIQLDEYTLPKGCTIAVMIMKVHRDPSQYPRPNVFDPDNFLPERIKQRSPYSFIPFSAGHRTCIGQRYAMLLIKVLLANILRRYTVTSTVPMKEFQLAAQTTLKRKDGFRIRLRKRHIETIH